MVQVPVSGKDSSFFSSTMPDAERRACICSSCSFLSFSCLSFSARRSSCLFASISATSENGLYPVSVVGTIKCYCGKRKKKSDAGEGQRRKSKPMSITGGDLKAGPKLNVTQADIYREAAG